MREYYYNMSTEKYILVEIRKKSPSTPKLPVPILKSFGPARAGIVLMNGFGPVERHAQPKTKGSAAFRTWRQPLGLESNIGQSILITGIH